jgi:transcriptional regulator with XRE-family HTH domain
MPKVKTRGKPTLTDKHVGAKIRLRRLTLGLSQTNLGDAVDITFQQVQKYEKGTNRVSASRIQQLAKVLSVPVSFFFEGAPEAVTNGRKLSENSLATPAYVTDFLGSRDGHKIMKAFSRITDRKVRRKMVALAEELAGG